MYTLTNILTELKTFATNHKQIKGSFYFGERLNANALKSVKYPFLFCEFNSNASVVGENYDSYNFGFTILDCPNQTIETEFNKIEILSDTKLIANDIVAYFRYTDFNTYLVIDLPVTMSPVENVFDDNNIGWTFKVNLKLNQGLNTCDIPISSTTYKLLLQNGNYLLLQNGAKLLLQ